MTEKENFCTRWFNYSWKAARGAFAHRSALSPIWHDCAGCTHAESGRDKNEFCYLSKLLRDVDK
jgi:hypothetical protein